MYAGMVRIPIPEHEFGCYLVKKIAKMDLDETHGSYLSSLWRKDREGCKKQVLRVFSSRIASNIIESADKNSWMEVIFEIKKIRRMMFLWTSFQNPVASVAYWVGEGRRVVERTFRPTGMIICVLGPDGSGKSTVLEFVGGQLAPAFRGRTARFHLRYSPANVSSGCPVIDPHAKAPYGLALSLVKLAYLWGIYWTGFLVRGLPRKIRSTLILFDRYFDDMIMDPRRYRYGGPPGLARLVARLIPRPDLFLVLDAPAEVLQLRKREVPMEETERQRQAYLAFAASTPNARVIDASQPIEDVVRAANLAILDFMAERTANRLRRMRRG
jgi:thymidylate kinase